MSQRRWMILGVPIAAVALLAGALLLRRAETALPPVAVKPSAPAPKPLPKAGAQEIRRAEPPPPVSMAPEQSVSRAMDDERVRVTYQNFRTAVATGNRGMRDALLPVLRREEKTAVRLAEEDLAQAPTDLDREIARKTLDALRRQP